MTCSETTYPINLYRGNYWRTAKMINITAELARIYAGVVTRQPKKVMKDLPSVRSSTNIPYADDRHKGHFIDVFWSVETVKPTPTIVFFNGGAFFHGSRSSSESICQTLAQRGFTVINADFRDLARDVDITDELKDAVAILNWMNFNRGRYGFDLDRCYTVGTSYGGLMALWFSLLCNSHRINDSMGLKTPWTTVKGVGIISGMTDIDRNTARMMIIKDSIEKIRKRNRGLAEALVPGSNHELRTISRIYQITSDYDRAKPDVMKFKKLLDINRVENDVMVFEAKEELMRGFVAKNPLSPESARSISAMLRFLDREVNDGEYDREETF